MPGPRLPGPPPPSPPPPSPPRVSSTAAILAHHASLRARVLALRAAPPPEPRLRLAALLSPSASPRGVSAPVRALRAAALRRVQAYAGHGDDDHDDGMYDAAVAALDAFVSTRVEDARGAASALFAKLCASRDWTSLAVFSPSSVAEEAVRVAGGEKRRFTVIDAAPEYEGRAVAKRLAGYTEASVRYGVLGNCQRLLDGAHVVVIGAEEVTMNGCVLAAPGASVIAQVAKEIGIPVIVTTQAVKFSEGMVVDWTYGGFDVLKTDEVLLVVTEMELSEANVGIAPWMAPDVSKALARLKV